MARTLESIRNARMYSTDVGETTEIGDAGVVNHGLVSVATISFETDKKVLQDTSDGTGGAFATHFRVTTMSGVVTMREEIAMNFQMAFRATETAGSTANEKVYNFLAAPAFERRLLFKGVSETNLGDTFLLEVYRAKFSPVESFEMITDDFSETTLNFDVLTNPDATDLADKFAKMTVVKAAA